MEKYARRLPGFDDKVISMYARGMTTREIRGHVEELYGLSVSAELISKVTDAVHDEIREWQTRSMEDVYAVVYFDAVRAKVRDEGLVRNKAVYLGIGVTCAGRKEVLGLWIEQTEGARFWFAVMNELKARDLRDVLIAVVDGLKGFPEVIESVYPQATVQMCIVHMIRRSLAHASWKERKARWRRRWTPSRRVTGDRSTWGSRVAGGPPGRRLCRSSRSRRRSGGRSTRRARSRA